MASKHHSISEKPRCQGVALDSNEPAAVEPVEALVAGLFAIGRATGRECRSLAVRLANRLRDSNVRRELAAMSDRELEDIGLSRSDLYRKGFTAQRRESAKLVHPAEATIGTSNENRTDQAAA